MSYIVKIDDKEFRIDITKEGDRFKILLNNQELPAEVVAGYHGARFTLIVNKKLYDIVFNSDNQISVNEEEYTAEIYDEQVHKLIKASPEASHKKEIVITVPMPGLVIDIEVKEGNQIAAGQGLVIVEAMKMQNEIKAPRDGIVKKIFVKKGQTVNSRDKLLIIE
jgi:biotin carboxyl carrier protein